MATWLLVASVGADDLALLKRNGIQPTSESIAAFLKRTVAPAAHEETARLITLLGDRDFGVREKASQKVVTLPNLAVELLRKATKSPDLEVRYRALTALEMVEAKAKNHVQLLESVFAVVRDNKLKGLVDELLLVMPKCRPDFVHREGARTLSATASVADVELLVQASRNKSLPLAAAATSALAGLDSDPARGRLRESLESEREPIRLLASKVFAEHADPVCLRPLIALLESSDGMVRMQSHQILKAITGEDDKFNAHAEALLRQQGVDTWKGWLDKNADKVVLKKFDEKLVFAGRLLVCVQGQQKLIEYDASGAVIWEVKNLRRPWACQGLPNGHRLVGLWDTRSLEEYDAAGKVVWKMQGLPAGPGSVQRLANGNILVACSDSHRVVEIGQDKTTKWSVTISGRPFTAQRLKDGLTLVTLHRNKTVVEVDKTGKVVWTLPYKFSDPQSAQRLDNGNTLVADHGSKKLLELTRDGKLVWSHTSTHNVYHAHRLPDGSVLFVDTAGVKVVSVFGKIIRDIKLSGACRAVGY